MLRELLMNPTVNNRAAYAKAWREKNPESYRRSLRRACIKSKIARLPRVLARQAAVKARRSKVCQHCGRVFENRKPTARFCSRDCARAARAARLPSNNRERKAWYRATLHDSYIRKLLEAGNRIATPAAIEAKRRELRRARAKCAESADSSPQLRTPVGDNEILPSAGEPRSAADPASARAFSKSEL